MTATTLSQRRLARTLKDESGGEPLCILELIVMNGTRLIQPWTDQLVRARCGPSRMAARCAKMGFYKMSDSQQIRGMIRRWAALSHVSVRPSLGTYSEGTIK